jgi:hypothetical protein
MVSSIVSMTIVTASMTATAVIGLVILLVTRELADASESPLLRLLSRHTALFSMPLLIVFVFIAIMKTLQAI